MARWRGPNGFTSTFEVFGGRWTFVMHGPDGSHHPSAVAARIRHIVEPANEQNLDRLLSVLAADR